MVKRGGAALSALTSSGWRLLRILGVGILVLVAGSIFLTPVHSLWSSNLLIKGDASVRKVPDHCKDMHFDSYIWGTDSDDVLYGTNGNDMIWGLGGKDRIYGHGGDDCFDGGGNYDRCDDNDGWFDARTHKSTYDIGRGEHDSRRNSCDQWGPRFSVSSWWHHSTPTIELAWEPVTGAVYYNVYRATEEDGPYDAISSTKSPAYTDIDILENTPYYYVLTAVDADGFESVPSLETSQLVPSQATAPGYEAPTDTETPAPEDTPLGGEPTDTPASSETPAPHPSTTPVSEPEHTATPAPTKPPTPAPTKPAESGAGESPTPAATFAPPEAPNPTPASPEP